MFNQPNIVAFFFSHRLSFQNKSTAAGGDTPAEQIVARGFHWLVLGSACGNGTGLAHSALSTTPPPPLPRIGIRQLRL